MARSPRGQDCILGNSLSWGLWRHKDTKSSQASTREGRTQRLRDLCRTTIVHQQYSTRSRKGKEGKGKKEDKGKKERSEEGRGKIEGDNGLSVFTVTVEMEVTSSGNLGDPFLPVFPYSYSLPRFAALRHLTRDCDHSLGELESKLSCIVLAPCYCCFVRFLFFTCLIFWFWLFIPQ